MQLTDIRTKSYKTVKQIAIIINIALVFLIICFVKGIWEDDFATLIYIFCYPILLALNFIVFIVLNFLKDSKKEIFKNISIVLLLLFIPFLIIIPLFCKISIFKIDGWFF